MVIFLRRLCYNLENYVYAEEEFRQNETFDYCEV